MPVKVGYAVGRCPACGKVHMASRPTDMVTCECYRICPLCKAEMKPYTPDLTPSTYGKTGARDLKVLFYCDRHIPPHYSSQKPVEVTLQ